MAARRLQLVSPCAPGEVSRPTRQPDMVHVLPERADHRRRANREDGCSAGAFAAGQVMARVASVIPG